MSGNLSPDQERQRQQRNQHAREVLSGSDVRLSHRPATPQSNGPASFSVPSIGSGSRTAYLAAIGALAVIGFGVYIFGGFELASIILFILSLVLMASWYVF